MKKKGRKARSGRVDKPVENLDEKGSIMHYNAVLIEDLHSKMQLVLECVQALAERMDRLEQRMDGLEGRVSTLELAVRGLRDDMLDMERRICSKINRITERCENHECRLGALEAS